MVTAYCVAITDDEYYNTGLEVVACENDQDPDKSQESILARLGSDERGGIPYLMNVPWIKHRERLRTCASVSLGLLPHRHRFEMRWTGWNGDAAPNLCPARLSSSSKSPLGRLSTIHHNVRGTSTHVATAIPKRPGARLVSSTQLSRHQKRAESCTRLA